MIPKFITELVTALWDRTHAAPFAIADLEDLIHQILRHQISIPLHDARILVFDVPFTLFELLHRHENTLENIQRFEPGDHDRNAKALRDGLVLSIPHDGTYVTGAQEPLHAIEWRLQNRSNGRRHQHMGYQD